MLRIRTLLTHARFRLATVLLLVMATSVAIGLLHGAGGFLHLEMLAYDYLLGFKVRRAPREDRILLVKITEPDIQRLGHWPLTDAELAQALTQLLAHQPRVIGIDLYRDVEVPPGTGDLRALFSANRHIVNIFKMHDPGLQAPKVSGAASGTALAFCDLPVDPDAMIRRGLLYMDDGQTSFPSFALLMALGYLRADGVEPEAWPARPDTLKLGQAVLAPLTPNDGGYVGLDTRGYQFLLDYGRGAFQSTTLSELLDARTEAAQIRDRVVIVGVAAESVKDIFFTPVKRSLLSPGSSYGIEVHAQIVSQLIRLAKGESAGYAFLGAGWEQLWFLFWGMSAALVAARSKRLSTFSVLIVVGLGLFGAVAGLLFARGVWLPVIPALLSYILCGGMAMAVMTFGERSDKKTLLQIFSQHVSQDVARLIIDHKEKLLADGRPISQKLTATVLFVDVKGFTSVAEGLEPQQLMDWLNAYLGAMTDVIIRHQGVINKYIGDAVMAIFGVPFARDSEAEIRQDAVNAVASALAMGQAVEGMNQALSSWDRPRAQIRIGINTGPLVAGCVGNEQRMEYTVLGDTVNIASRLEGLKLGGGAAETGDFRLYVGETTWQLVRGRFTGRHIGNMELKGKQTRVNVYQVLGER